MNDEQKLETTGASDKAKLYSAIILVFGGVAAYYALGGLPAWLRWLAVVAGVVLGVLVLIPSKYGRDLRQFWMDSRVELRKIVWPTRRETGMTTLVVFFFTALSGVFFWLVDLALAWAMRHITGQGG
ncbi:MAG: preprotein translocase subunit SecE [Acetobacteraceae bacterium]